jgi:ectoine hydroxylase-related dioxygenase (phytanoyl-CoA dioxygenase family)
LDVAPEARGIKPVTHELKAGSVTFHHGLCFHYAGPNRSQGTREALAIIYMPTTTRYDSGRHPVSDHLGLKEGDVFNGETFPVVSTW